MIERKHRYGNLVFDRNAIVRAALRAYFEAIFGSGALKRLSFPACADPRWTGDLERGAFYNGDGCGNYEVVAWTEASVVALAYELGWGPIEQLGLSASAVTGGPDDVRGALPDLPEELEPALVMATGMLGVGPEHGQRDAGVGFWLYGARVGGTLFSDPTSPGARGLARWGLLQGGRLRSSSSFLRDPSTRAAVAECDRKDAPIHALIDAVVDRRLKGPTEFTAEEFEMLFHSPPDPKQFVGAQRMLQQVGITWPGSPEIPELPRQRRRNPFLPEPLTTTVRPRRGADQDTIVRAALRAYVENILARLDPLDRHPFAASFVPHWTGDLRRGAFRNGDGGGSYEVMAWSEAGVVGLAYELGYGPIEHIELPIDAVKGGPDDVRVAVAELPAELLPTLELAVGLLEVGAHGEKLASVGFWLHGEQVGGSFYDSYIMKGAGRLRAWHSLKGGRLRRWFQGGYVADLGLTKAAPIQALVDAVTTRALAGPTELTPDELEMLLPTPPDPSLLLAAQRMLQKVGITWPGSPEIPD
ncbi:hypothetical protein [Polyangium sp. 15x6]|uniref:hypothetical protein n=1 Tax=Polyangium sp. 15x6 TaxID=3042687 RepID=UPI00249A5F70|nr:hypothetical protein [Polyangium sp. 15x6]MDI3289337.1 hypothetical protein [Polyangium sp. 15x6]